LDEATPGFIKKEEWPLQSPNCQTAIQWITQFGTPSKKRFTLREKFSENELKQKITEEWENITLEVIRK